MQFVMLIPNCSVNNKYNFKKSCQIPPGVSNCDIISRYTLSAS